MHFRKLVWQTCVKVVWRQTVRADEWSDSQETWHHSQWCHLGRYAMRPSSYTVLELVDPQEQMDDVCAICAIIGYYIHLLLNVMENQFNLAWQTAYNIPANFCWNLGVVFGFYWFFAQAIDQFDTWTKSPPYITSSRHKPLLNQNPLISDTRLKNG